MFGGWNLQQHAGRVGGHAAEKELVARSRVRACWLCCVAVLCHVPGVRQDKEGWSSPAYRASAAPGDQDHFFHAWCVQRSVISPANLCPPAAHATGRMACAAPVWHVPATPCGLCRPLASVTCLIRLQAVGACSPFLAMPPTGRGHKMPVPQGCVPSPTCPQLPVWVLAGCHVTCVCVLGRGAERGVLHC